MSKVVSDKRGYFGAFGGCFAPETLMPALYDLEQAYNKYINDDTFNNELQFLLKQYSGRPTPVYEAKRLTDHLGGARIFLKREDLNHTGAHKINNCLGQGLLAKYMGKKRLIAETGAGQHGVATATIAAHLGMKCTIYMGSVDMARQSPNVFRMRLLGAEVVPVESGTKTLKDAVNETLRDWIKSVRDSHCVMGSVLGPHPFPEIVAYFQSIIGKEAREQILEQTDKLPDKIIACVGGGSNAIGIFKGFVDDSTVELIGVEAGGFGINTDKHAIRLTPNANSRPGILQGYYSYILQDNEGQIATTHSVSAGLDYSGVGPEHAYLHDIERAQYTFATDDNALDAFKMLSEIEGIIPALESSHALAHAIEIAPSMSKDSIILVNLSGRGDKDIHIVAEHMGIKI